MVGSWFDVGQILSHTTRIFASLAPTSSSDGSTQGQQSRKAVEPAVSAIELFARNSSFRTLIVPYSISMTDSDGYERRCGSPLIIILWVVFYSHDMHVMQDWCYPGRDDEGKDTRVGVWCLSDCFSAVARRGTRSDIRVCMPLHRQLCYIGLQ